MACWDETAEDVGDLVVLGGSISVSVVACGSSSSSSSNNHRR
jgi:hypothetical protein